MWRRLLLGVVAVTLGIGGGRAHPAARPARVLIVVFDGLRPDAITPDDAPTLWRLSHEGVSFANTHAAFPTVTRVNGAALATGSYPGTNGLVSNELFVPAVDSTRAFSTSDYHQLLRTDSLTNGHLLDRPTLAELLARHGVSYAAVSSGSGGNALVANRRAPVGQGVLVDGQLGDGVVAFPRALSDSIVSRVGAPPHDSGARNLVSLVEWTERAIEGVVLPEVCPRVLVDWITEPDESQHHFGPGSPEARAALRAADATLGRLLDALGSRRDSTDVIVLSDHGFTTVRAQVNVSAALDAAGFATASDSGHVPSVVVANNSQSVLFYVRRHDRARVVALASMLQRAPWVDVVFTHGAPGHTHGWVPGTVSLDVVHLQHTVRAPDVAVTLRWSTDTNRYGVAGSQVAAFAGTAGPDASLVGSHGGLAPFTVRNTLIMWGPSFRRGVVDSLPVGTVDVAPTVLTVLGLAADTAGMDGRVIAEALRDGSPGDVTAARDSVLVRGADGYRAVVRRVRLGRHWYIDAGERLR